MVEFGVLHRNFSAAIPEVRGTFKRKNLNMNNLFSPTKQNEELKLIKEESEQKE